MKTCTACGLLKELAEFHHRAAAKDGYQGICKVCNCAQRKAYYKTARGRETAAITGKGSRVRNRSSLYQYLLQHSCIDCGEADPVVLEFDHMRDKSCNISQMASAGRSWPSILEEIAKCQVRCANCHKRRTAKQQGWYKAGFRTE